jgi:hypothetical protein
VAPSRDDYRRELRGLRCPADWEPYLRARSGLPGPRANLELLGAAADVGGLADFERLVASDDEFLAACGAAGLGQVVATGEHDVLPRLRALASDPRWRVREGVAMGLQRIGDADLRRLLAEIEDWAAGSPLEQRAAIAALCEPRLLRDPEHVRRVLAVLDRVTTSLAAGGGCRAEPRRVLRQALGYCWSVAAAALPEAGGPALDRWMGTDDPDVRWVMRRNLSKARMRVLGAGWVAERRARLESAAPA